MRARFRQRNDQLFVAHRHHEARRHRDLAAVRGGAPQDVLLHEPVGERLAPPDLVPARVELRGEPAQQLQRPFFQPGNIPPRLL